MKKLNAIFVFFVVIYTSFLDGYAENNQDTLLKIIQKILPLLKLQHQESVQKENFRSPRVELVSSPKVVGPWGNVVIPLPSDSPASSGDVTGPSSSTPNAVVLFGDNSGKLLKNSSVLVDDLGNIEIQGITKNGNNVSWPSIIGAPGTFLASDGSGNLIYGVPAGGGNVSTALQFVNNNAIVTTDIASSTENVKESLVSVDTSGNINNVNTLNALVVNAPTLNGNATSATLANSTTNFSGLLSGDVTGAQGATVVNFVGGQTAANIANASIVANSATSSNTPNTIVARDGFGNFAATTITAALTGAASQNVLKDGDTMTGNLAMANQSEIRLQDAAGGEYVGLRGPATITSSYTVDMPSSVPTTGQFLQAISPASLQWSTIGGSPTVSKTYYVALNGSDSNDGSLPAPFRTISHAVNVANGVASLSNPILISVGAGIFVENNSGGPIQITANGISLIGRSLSGTIIIPSTLANNLFSCTTPNFEFMNFYIDAGASGSTAAGIAVATNAAGAGRFNSIQVSRFATGLDLSSAAGVPVFLFDNVQMRGNTVCLAVNNIRAAVKNSIFVGPFAGSIPSNTAITITGSTTLLGIASGTFTLFNTAISSTGGANVRLTGSVIEVSVNGLVASGASNTALVGCNFNFNPVGAININVSGANTQMSLDGTHFNCVNALGAPQGIALQSTNGALLLANTSSITGAQVGIKCGNMSDTSSTEIRANTISIKDCISHIQQEGSSTLRFVGGIFDTNLVSISDPTNVTFASYDRISNNSLTLGKTEDVAQELYQVFNGQTEFPNLTYQPNYYGNKGIVYTNPNSNPTFNATQSNSEDSSYYIVTGDRTKQACINLISDSGTIGNSDNVRGWEVTKAGTSADLEFNYSNNDTSGQAARGSNTVMNIDGFNNVVAFPEATNAPLPTNTVATLEWAGDTTLYRDSANTLKTDGDLIVGALTPAGIVHNDVNGLLSTSLIVNADISSSAGITDDKLATISTSGKVANSATTATSSNVPNTIVLRDGLGNFAASTITAALVGAASQNVLKAGDTMTGNLAMANQSEIQLQDAAGGEYVGLRGPATIASSYTVDVPSSAPTAGQVLQASSSTSLQWATVGGSPTVSKIYYVALNGSDSNDGSLTLPFRTISHAVNVANGVASLSNPVVIAIGAGIFVENNSGGPILITADGISIIGRSLSGTIIIPSTLANNLFSCTTPNFEFMNFYIDAGAVGSTAIGIAVVTNAPGVGRFTGVQVARFATGLDLSSAAGLPIFLFDNVQMRGNTVCLAVSNAKAVVKNSNFLGPFVGNITSNTAITITGPTALVAILSNAFRLFTTAIATTGGANLRLNGSIIEATVNGVVASGASYTALVGCNFNFNPAGAININVSGANTQMTIDGSHFNCADASGIQRGTALQVTDSALFLANTSSIVGAQLGIKCGTMSDTSSTEIRADAIIIKSCISDIEQEGSSTLRFVGGIFDANLISINDSTNVAFAAYDRTSDNSLTLGKTEDVSQELYQVFNGQTELPNLTYQSDYYGNKGTVYTNPNSNPTFNATQSNSEDSSYYVITGDRIKQASINLISDSGTIGNDDNVRGWEITKVGTSADLEFNYSNNDTSGQAERGSNSTIRVDGFNNIVEFPEAVNSPLPTNAVAKLEWAGDTTLYRDSANTLKTDGDLIVGALTPAGVVHNDVNGLLSTSLIVNADISSSAGIIDNKLATISTSGKVANSATTATSSNIPNTIVLRDSLGNFAANTVTANLTGNADTATAANSSINFTGSLAGDVTGTQNTTQVNSVGGQTAANIATATIVANAATNTNTPNTIVLRDSLGNFAAGTITANIIGNVVGNLTGNASTATTAGSATNFTGTLIGDVLGTQNATQVSTVGGQTAANIAAATVLTNAATSSNTASTIVRRDGSGNIEAGIITASLIGNVTGNLIGNADTATTALTANSATNFTGSLSGDVTGTQSTTQVNSVGGQSAANIASATIAANAATSNNMPNTIVSRDASGNFITNMITLGGTVLNPTDAATKAYVDTVAALGLDAKTPALVVSTTDITLSGLQTIDGVLLNDGDRVLLVAQTNSIENGLWEAHAGAWTRPSDFSSGSTAGQAYVLITSGTVNAGSSWLCSTPTAIIDTDPITFALFSLPEQTTGANVGTGIGQVFRDKTGVTLNFKTINGDPHVIVTNNPNDITLSTDAIAVNTPNTIVARDGMGNFAASTITAALTGAASQNVLKTGDTMTGNLIMSNQSEIQLQDAAGGEYVGLRGPATITSSYTVDLPSNAPTTGQFLQAISPTSLQWVTAGGSPTVSKIYYVALNGSDSNDGSLPAPFRTISHAVSVANGVATLSNPIVISIGAGIFVEDNSGGPIQIIADGINIIGRSLSGTIIIPSTLANNLFSCTTPNFEFTNLYLDAGTTGSTATGIAVVTNAPGVGRFTGVQFSRFATGLDLSSAAGLPIFLFDNVQMRGNTIGIAVSNVKAVIKNSNFLGPFVGNTPSNTAITITGSTTLVAVLSDSFRLFTTAISTTGGANLRLSGCIIEATINGVVASGASYTALVGCNFNFSPVGAININVSGANTQVTIDGSHFNCADASGTPQGIAFQLTDGAVLFANTSSIKGAQLGIKCGNMSDTSSTELRADTIVIKDCVSDIEQEGSSTLRFVGGVFDANLISVNDATNVAFAAYDRNSNNSLTLGKTVDAAQELYQILNGQAELPNLTYQSDYYGHKGTVYSNPNSNPTFNATQSDTENSAYYVITGDRTKQACINLISDSGTIGNSDNVRGWEVTKAGTSADLEFNYSNNDTSGQAARGSNTTIRVDGFNNVVEFPEATNAPLPTNTVATLEWAGDTTLYRDSANTLKTDGDLIVGALTPAGIVHNDANGLLSTSLILNADISTSAGITDDKLATISTSGKVANSATTATSTNTPNTIVLRDGLGNFAAGTITANLIGNADTATTANSATNFTGSLLGDVTGTQGATIVSSVGGQTAANIAAATTLANSATNTNTASTIVRRDALGNFAAGTITANLAGNVTGNLTGNADTATSAISATNFTGSLVGDVIGTQNATQVSTVGGQTAANVAAATVLANAATSSNTASTIVRRDALGNFAAGTITANLNGNANTATTATTANSATNFTGSLVGDVTGTQGATVVSSVGGQSAANVAAATVLANAATNNNTASSIVRRDPSGNFAAGTITANLTGNASTATTANSATNFTGSLSGDVTGTQGATIVSSVGGQSAANVAAATIAANAATNTNTANTIVLRDSLGNFAAGTITANIIGNVVGNLTGNASTATTANSATNFTGSLVGDVTGTQGATVVSSVGGQSAANVAAATTLANASTSSNTASTIVRRDALGNFAAGTITSSIVGNVTGNLTGNASTATTATTANSATNFTGSLVGDVTGTQGATVVSSVGGQSAANVAAATVLANAATNNNTASTIVRRDPSGNFAAGTITANLTGNASTATTANSATNFTGSLSGDVTGIQGATVVSSVGGQTAANVAAATVLANAATNNNTASTIVRRDVSGNFSASTITASLTGAASLNVLKAGDTMTGTLQLPAGTVAAPSLQFTGSTNTGMSAPSANTLSLSTSGSERFKIDTTGSVTFKSNYKMYAYRSTNQTVNTTTATIIFDTELLDPNSNYNNATGIYTTPVTGVYQISVNVTVQAGANAATETMNIVRNGTAVTGASASQIQTTSGARLSLATTVFLSLTAGDLIRIDLTTNKNDTVIANDTHLGIHYMSF